MKLPLYERVALLIDVPDKGLKKGDVVTTVEFLEARRDLPSAFVVEAFNAVGETIAVLTVPENDLEALTQCDVPHVRRNLSPVDQIVVLDEVSTFEESSTSTASSPDIVTVSVPRALLEQTGITAKALKLQWAIFLFQQDIVSLGKASEYAELHSLQFQKELASRQIPVHYDVEDFQRDLDSLNRDEKVKRHSFKVS